MPAGQMSFSSQTIKLAVAFSPRLRTHLLEGLGLCFIACLPSSQSGNVGTRPASLPGIHLSTSTQIISAKEGRPSKRGLPDAESGDEAGGTAAATAAAEGSAQQILQDLRDMLRAALSDVPQDLVSHSY